MLLYYPQGSCWEQENSRRTVRKRIEHVYGFMQNSMKAKFICSDGSESKSKNRHDEFCV
jgi:hypothetical protein